MVNRTHTPYEYNKKVKHMIVNMSKEKIKKLLPIFIAISENTPIQIRAYHDGVYSNWIDVTDDSFIDISGKFEYRIKPEPKYVPFSYENYPNLINKVITWQTEENDVITENVGILTKISKNGVFCGAKFWNWEDFLLQCKFLKEMDYSGSNRPCGIEVYDNE